jgi:hypothetical protein
VDHDIEQLEQELATRSRSGPSGELRARVLREVGRKLQDEQRRGAWLFAASVAAVFVIWLNLSWFAARETDFFELKTVSATSVDEITDQIQRLVPELSRQEAGRQALLLHSCNGLGTSPRPFPMQTIR